MHPPTYKISTRKYLKEFKFFFRSLINTYLYRKYENLLVSSHYVNRTRATLFLLIFNNKRHLIYSHLKNGTNMWWNTRCLLLKTTWKRFPTVYSLKEFLPYNLTNLFIRATYRLLHVHINPLTFHANITWKVKAGFSPDSFQKF